MGEERYHRPEGRSIGSADSHRDWARLGLAGIVLRYAATDGPVIKTRPASADQPALLSRTSHQWSAFSAALIVAWHIGSVSRADRTTIRPVFLVTARTSWESVEWTLKDYSTFFRCDSEPPESTDKSVIDEPSNRPLLFPTLHAPA
nr:hypothetical protein CFP56_11746 [Quercus suber]